MFFAFVNTTAIKSLCDFLEYLIQVFTASQSTSKKNNLLTDGFCSFDHTPAWNLPTPNNHHPMHNNHTDSFRIKVAKDVPSLQTARDLRLSVLLPQLEDQLDLPSCS